MLDKIKGGALVVLFLGLTYMFFADYLFQMPLGMHYANIGRTATIGLAIFSLEGYVVPFEIIGLLLLAAMIGGLVLAKEETSTK